MEKQKGLAIITGASQGIGAVIAAGFGKGWLSGGIDSPKQAELRESA